MNERFTMKNDKYQKAREGSAKFLSVFCGQCNKELLLYQKDGSGNLIRMYLDRIIAPINFVNSLKDANNKLGIKSLICSNCGTIMATPMVYEKENRLALRITGPVKKIINKKGIYPYES